ncbi:alanine dehydrogenase [Mycolicibacterium chubuense]|uniref:N(5)-(Carboxyethyl)ornithine synthase n=1 Tax=Mycolicibacterium chubuense TaxID=1800 RepID=A0A0J6WPZ3_MYCCU|nr:N(5)-(carboxyethyl)ornithine synthase [Mycolicibacterium chubuense]KMO84178.1 N(5)-(carboxyethyl)ornithine synthase [Mycolicibacterium chubuense]ORA43316.1 alanine dehydrogenase [Mycolicibacterium chubuense]SPX99798.1 alanine dehydrogenase [Mycolicibacterium chubuense]
MTTHTDTPALSLGVLATSRKPDERRLPIHPDHFARIDPSIAARIFVEQGYGAHFGATDDALADLVGGIRTREQLIADCDVILLPKVEAEDLAEFREGQIVWGWPHLVQNPDVTQAAIDRRLTMIAFESMNHWNSDGSFALHVFHKNNEMAGYCSVLHALQLIGVTGNYGRRLSAAVIGFGATARGAVTALNAHGVDEVHVLTNRDVAAVAAPIPSVQLFQMSHDDDDPPEATWVDTPDDGVIPVAQLLAGHDIAVNCVLQNPNNPLIFATEADLAAFTPGSVIVDVSCDAGMGFTWAEPTSFADPLRLLPNGIHYYAVDHSPSYLFNSATWEISEALLPHLETVLGGPTAWEDSTTVQRAVEMRDGVVLNEEILSFQGRGAEYPHRPTASPAD